MTTRKPTSISRPPHADEAPPGEGRSGRAAREPAGDAGQRVDKEGPPGFPREFDEEGTVEDLQHGGYQAGDQGGYQGSYDEDKFERHPLAREKAESPDPGDSRTDAQLLEDIRRRLAEGGPWLQAGGVQVAVRDGRAVLDGTVGEERTRRDIEAAVSLCEGLAGLDNRIRVLPP